MTRDSVPLILPLAEAHDSSLVGGKAVNLAAMIRAGLPVPDGFVVTTAAYLARNTHRDEIFQQVRQAHAKLVSPIASPLVAARSSATAEDLAGASMAGQYETFLNLATVDALFDAVIGCWKSVQSDRVRAYLSEQSIDCDTVCMAVVVQRLVPATVAGVLFTTNPRTGSSSEMLIEAAWGLGESVVSGQVQPDLIRVATERCEVLQYTLADKSIRLLPGHSEMEATPDNLRRRACLDFTAIRQLAELGRRAARHFDHPQDIEWAIDDAQQVHLLQSRAITTLDDAAAYQSLLAHSTDFLHRELDAGRGPWVQHNLDETLHNPTPLSWDVVSRYMSGEGGFGQMYRRVGFAPSKVVAQAGFLELIGSGIYMDCARMPEMFFAEYPFAYDVDLLRDSPDAAQAPPTIPRGTTRQRGAAARRASEVTRALHREAETLDRSFDETLVPAIDAWLQQETACDLSNLDNEQLIARWSERECRVMNDFGAEVFLPSMIEALALADLHNFITDQLWDEDPDELVHLLSVSPQPDRTSLANAQLREVAHGSRSLDVWLSEHGHRAPGEFDLATPRWHERPHDVLALSDQLRDSTDPNAKHEARISEAEATLASLKQVLCSRNAEQLVSHVRLLQRYVRFREDGKYQLMRGYAVLRETALEFGRRLKIGDDIFFLTIEEINDTLRGGYLPEDRIARRRTERLAAARLHVPRVIDRTDVAELGQITISDDNEQWPAHPVSNGTALGPARIILSPENAPLLESGYILVCPSTDPSWTPLFAKAAGLVLERGGTLSHGAIVARELGLPAVVLESATTLLADGQLIRVDANQGAVSRVDSVSQIDTDEPVTNTPATASNHTSQLERKLLPPPISSRETRVNQFALLAALIWLAFLAAFYLLPTAWIKQPAFRLIDVALWPLVRQLGMVGAVATIGGIFSLVLIVAQRWLTDNTRLLEAKRRAAALRQSAAKLPMDSPHRAAMSAAVKPVTGRMLRASMVPLAWLLGPMMLVFLWFPERVDPAVWNAEPGRGVSIVAEVDGDMRGPFSLEIAAGLGFETGVTAERFLPPIRQELEELRSEWSAASELGAFPWEVQAAGDHAREALLGSLDAFLRQGIPLQKLSWRLKVPEESTGRFTVRLVPPESAEPLDIPLVFGNAHPPELTEIDPSDRSIVRSITVIHPRPLTQRKFWTPLVDFGGPAWDFGWLGVYLIAYLAVMFVGKRVFGVP